jgi:hypothetical protein
VVRTLRSGTCRTSVDFIFERFWWITMPKARSLTLWCRFHFDDRGKPRFPFLDEGIDHTENGIRSRSRRRRDYVPPSVVVLDRIQPLQVSCVDESFTTTPKGGEGRLAGRLPFLHPFEPRVRRFRRQHKPLSPSPTLRVLMYRSIPSTTRIFISSRYRNPSQPWNPFQIHRVSKSL